MYDDKCALADAGVVLSANTNVRRLL